jgi:hypothetical protein
MIAPHDPRQPGQHGPWGGWRQQPVYDNQVGHRLPTGGKPAAGPLWVGLALFVLSPLTLLSWVAGQALLRATGLRWWKLALASLAGLVVLVWLEGGPAAALRLHFSGWLFLLRQFGAPVIHLPMPGAVLLPQLPLSLLVGLLAASLNVAGGRQPFDPAEVRRQARETKRRRLHAIRRAEHVRDDHDQVPAFAAAIDGDLGLTARDGLVYLPWWIARRSRLIAGTSGMGKSVDIEREALLAASAGRKLFVIDGKGTDPGLPVPARGCKGCGCRVRAGFGVVCGRGWLSFLPPMMAVACERVVGSTVGRKADRAATPYGAVDAAAREQTIRRWAGRTAVVAPARWRLRLWV